MAKTRKRVGADDKFEINRDAKGEYRWTRKAPNGKIVGASTEGYKKKSDCRDNAIRNGWDGKED